MSAACKTILQSTPEVQSRRLGPANGRQRSPACSTRGGIGRLCCDGIRLVAKPQRKPQTFLRQTHGRPAPPANIRAAPRWEAVHCPCEHCNKAACVGAAAPRHRPAYKQPPSDKPNHHRLTVRGHATKPYSSPIAQLGGISGFLRAC
jgi:hypothetical protein